MIYIFKKCPDLTGLLTSFDSGSESIGNYSAVTQEFLYDECIGGSFTDSFWYRPGDGYRDEYWYNDVNCASPPNYVRVYVLPRDLKPGIWTFTLTKSVSGLTCDGSTHPCWRYFFGLDPGGPLYLKSGYNDDGIEEIADSFWSSQEVEVPDWPTAGTPCFCPSGFGAYFAITRLSDFDSFSIQFQGTWDSDLPP